MIEIVGKLIKDEVNELSQGDKYPAPHELNDIDNLNNWIPPSLQKLLRIIVPGDLKQIAIGHTIISASKRKFFSPLLFGLGVQLDHSFGSKWLNNHLARLGFSVTYSQVRNYKKAVMESESLSHIIPPGSFVQWSADNVDHNCRTLDGKNTFHGMGIVASVTPSLSKEGIAIHRCKVYKNMGDISTNKCIPIHDYIGKAVHPESVKFKPYSSLREVAKLMTDRLAVLDLAWLANWTQKPSAPLSCNWSG